MANAMLEDDFKSSHPDLQSMTQQQDDPDNMSSAPPQQPYHNTRLSSSPSRGLTTRKSVEFAIQPPPPKRSRPDVPWTAKQVVDAISTSITRTERLEAIQNAKDSFNHDLEAVHDDEMKTGADATLTKHLTFLAFHAQQHQATTTTTTSTTAASSNERLQDLLTEISLTVDVLESLYRASSAVVGASFQRMGQELMQLLVGVLDNELERRRSSQLQQQQQQHSRRASQPSNHNREQQEAAATTELPDSSYHHVQGEKQPSTCAVDNDEGEEETWLPPRDQDNDAPIDDDDDGTNSLSPDTSHTGTPEGDLFLRKATKILGHFARVGEATRPMAHYPGLLGSLLSLISMQPYRAVPWEARLSALWILANLACNAENMQMMACTPGLIGVLVQVSCRPLHPGDDLESTMEILRSRSIASRAILNLSWSPENKIILAEHAPLVDLLCELTVHRKTPLGRSRTVQDILLSTRRHAVGALRNLAAAPRRIKIGLCEYRNGHLLNTLTDAALNDTDTGVKDRAFAAIHNLAIHDTAEKIVSHPALVLALKDVLLSEEDASQHEDGVSPKSHASATLLVLERTITPQMTSYDNLRDLLEAINPTTDTESEMEVLHPTAV